MIKKIITVAALFVLSSALTWAVWEGNAAAGSKEEFPSGFFASSNLFPPHTLIEIVNLEQNITSRAVILNNEETDGLLVKLSPDLAAALSIKAGTNVRVRISVPPLVAEEGADPVLLGKKASEKEALPLPAQDSTAPAAPVKIEPVQDAPVIAAAPRKQAAAEPTPQEVAEPHAPARQATDAAQVPSEVREPAQPSPAYTAAPAAPSDIAAPVEPAVEQTPTPESVADATDPGMPPQADAEEAAPVLALAPVPDAPVENPYQAAEPVPQVAEIASAGMPSDEATAEPVPEITAPAAPAADTAAKMRPVEEVSTPEPPIVEEEAEPPLYDEDDTIPESFDEPEEDTTVLEAAPLEEAEEEKAPIETEVLEAGEPAAEEAPPQEQEPALAEASAPTDVQPQEEPEPPVVEPVKEPPVAVAADEVQSDAAPEPVEQHVMLVPTAPRAPVGEVPPPAPKKREAAPQVAVAPVEKEKTPPPAAQPAVEPDTAAALKKGSFYVQIGRFKDAINVQSFVQRYGRQYPIAVEKLSSGAGNVYKIYIGPLQKDERGAALETFQRYGFKDAFLKKAP